MKELSYLTPENGHKLDHFTSSNTQFDANVNIKKFYFQVSDLEEIGVPECRGETKDEVTFGMFRDGLQNGAVHDDQMLRSGLHRPALQHR